MGPHGCPTRRHIGDFENTGIMRDDFFQEYDHSVFRILLTGIVKLPTVIIEIVRHVCNVRALSQDMLSRDHGAILRLIKWPRILGASK
jgi:hypothetical protein